MRLFIRGQEIATRTENLIQDQDVTDEVLNSVPIVLVTANKAPEPEPDMILTRTISNDLVSSATLEYNKTQQKLKLRDISWNPIFENKYATFFEIHLYPTINNEQFGVQTFMFSRGISTNVFDPYQGDPQTEQLQLINAQEELNNCTESYEVYCSVSEEDFNNIECTTYASIDFSKTAELEPVRKYLTFMQFFETTQYYLYRAVKTVEHDWREFAGSVFTFVRENMVDMPGLILGRAFASDNFTRNHWIVDINRPYNDPLILPDYFIAGMLDMYNDVDGEQVVCNGPIISHECVFDTMLHETYALSDSECPIKVSCKTEDWGIETAAMYANKSLALDGNGLYISYLPVYLNDDSESAPLRNGPIVWCDSLTHYNVDDLICSDGSVQIYTDGKDLEECNQKITQTAYVTRFFRSTLITEREV